MKRIVRLLMILLPVLLMGAVPAYAAGTTLVIESGIELDLLAFDINELTASASITLRIRANNQTDSKVWVELKDATVNGAPVDGTLRSVEAHTDTGEDSPLLYTIWAKDDDNGAGDAAIRSRGILEMVVDVEDNVTYDHFIKNKVTIDLSESVNAGASNDSSGGKAPAYTPASTSYETLAMGTKSQAVRDLQQRLTDLGYLNDKVDGSFGKNTATAVRSFCKQHNLEIQNEATPEMQRLLYSSNAEYYVEPFIPLVIGPQCKWDNPIYASLDNGTFYVQLVNRSQDRTIRGYELYYYKTDMWGTRYVEPTTGIEITQKTSFQQTIQPGYTVYSDPIMITPFSWTYTVWVGVHKIVFDDGEVREIPEDDVEYFSCVIKNG